MIDPDKIAALADEDIRWLLRVIATETLVTVLAGSAPLVAERVRKAANPRAAALLADEIALRGAVAPADYQMALAALARDLDQAVAEARAPSDLPARLKREG